MLALGIRYLNGFFAASEPDARERPEWPPHPARVFMALAAAHFQTGADPRERQALLWLESLSAPKLRAPAAAPRTVVTHYVPVNDKSGEVTKPPTAIIQSAPQLARDRQPRTFVRAWLEEDAVYLIWPDVAPGREAVDALRSLCAKVTRIGHSMSLVQMWVASAQEVGEANWVPDEERAELHLRVPGPGTLEDLEWCYNGGEVEAYAALVVAAEDGSDKQAAQAAKKRLKEEFRDGPPTQLRPQISRYHGYARPGLEDDQPRATGSVFSPHLIVFSLERQSSPLAVLGSQAVLQVVGRWREALVSHCAGAPERVRAIISGHRPDGGPLEEPHLALLPLAFVGHANADGHLVGLAAALPSRLDPEERLQVLRILGRVGELRLGSLGVWHLVRDLGDRPLWNLQPGTWTAHPAGATHWSTVTPVAFDRHPKEKDPAAYQREVAEMVARACVAIELPRPREVVITPVSAHLGVPPGHAFPRLARRDGNDRRHTHAILIFDEPVRGPMLIGAGRYRGYGVCRPMEQR